MSQFASRKPGRIWWPRPHKLCVLERPGGGGRSHRSDLRAAEVAYLEASGVWLVVSTMVTRHNLAEYEVAGLAWHHVPVASCAHAGDALDELLPLLRRELRRRGAVAVHGDRRTGFVAAVGAAHLHETRGLPPDAGLAAALEAGLEVTPASARLVGVDYEDVVAAPATTRSTRARASRPRPRRGGR
jgi:hypothetical protein